MLPKVDLVKGTHAEYLLFQANDAISNTLRDTGEWANDITAISSALYGCFEAPLILDIGANLGAYLLPIAKDIARTGGVVYAFEPQRIVYYQLCGNIVLNQLDNVFAFNQAVGDVAGSIDIPEINYATNSNVGAFSFNEYSRQFHGIESSMGEAKAAVPLITLDTLELPKAPALIKIDVEGYELNVFKGAVNFLAGHNYPPVLFEAWDFEWFAEDKKRLFDYVVSLGYDIIHIGLCDFLAQHPNQGLRVDIVTNADGYPELIRTISPK